jgi:hypothetical protein
MYIYPLPLTIQRAIFSLHKSFILLHIASLRHDPNRREARFGHAPFHFSLRGCGVDICEVMISRIAGVTSQASLKREGGMWGSSGFWFGKVPFGELFARGEVISGEGRIYMGNYRKGRNRLFRWLGSWVDIIATMCNRFWTLFHGVTLVGYLLLLFVLSFLLEGSWRGDLRECCGELGCLVCGILGALEVRC